MDAEALYFQLGHLLANPPDLHADWQSPAAQQWVGRATALVKAAGDSLDTAEIKVASSRLGTVLHSDNVTSIFAVLYRTLANAELKAPAAARGSFIPAGAPYAALSVVNHVLNDAQGEVLIVDPYADANLLQDYLVLAREGVSLRILADKKEHKPGLKAATAAWIKQHGAQRPLEVRLAAPGALHDRLIVLDGREAYALGQSFNRLATRAPTSLVRSDGETTKMKVAAYSDIWSQAMPLN